MKHAPTKSQPSQRKKNQKKDSMRPMGSWNYTSQAGIIEGFLGIKGKASPKSYLTQTFFFCRKLGNTKYASYHILRGT